MITVFRPQRERFKAFVTRSSLEIACVEIICWIERGAPRPLRLLYYFQAPVAHAG